MTTYGFTLIREENLSEAGGTVRLWKHDRSGAELLSVLNTDENKSFGVSFRTPPRDSTGVAHILEHSVLCGSRRYPVKEPFVELLKSSLQTFLNALTFPDKTCYPVASTNLQDFYNLIDVYLDAVFFPRIDEDVLRQEGWHIDVEPQQDAWHYKGVVFNEMKGVYSSPDSVLMEESQHAVFPDTLYSLDSGGNPEEIPNLSYEQFRHFHSAYYHPSNARFFFWGDDPEDARLKRLDAVLASFERRQVESAVPLQERRALARKVEVPYPAEEEPSGDARQGHVTVNWLLCETADTEEMLVLDMLEHILTGLPGSPLRKALMDSGLGDDITGAGLETDLRQAYFSIGLRSIRPQDSDAAETLIMDTLAELAAEGVPARAVEAALNSLEFELRENNTGRFPRGLAAMFRSLSTWLYDGDPFAPLAWEKPLAAVKARLKRREPVFENAIRRWFLDNTHRVTVVLTPDETLAAARQAREDARLAEIRTSMSAAQREEIARVSERLHLAQAAPDSPEALASIPALGLGDLPRHNAILPQAEKAGDVPFLLHELDSSGILYAKLLLPLDGVPSRLLPLLPLYGRALTEMGTARHSYVELGLEVAAQTGSLDAGPVYHTRLSDAAPLARLELSGKATADKAGKLTGLMREILTETCFDKRERFTQMVMEEKARLEQSLIPSGHSLVSVRLGARLSPTGWLAERSGGVSYLFYIRDLAQRLEQDWPSVLADLRQLHRLVARRNQALVSLTADAGTLASSEELLRDLTRALPDCPVEPQHWEQPGQPEPEALLIPAQVNYVGLGASLRNTGYSFHGSARVILRHLRMGYLWDRVRVQGGAYGSFVQYNRASGTLAFVSYRDPNVERTLDVYRGAADYLGNLSLSAEDVTRAIVGAIGDMDAYLLPGAKGNAALWRRLCGDTAAIRQRIREEILSTTLQDFHNFAPFLARALNEAVPCVLGGSDADAAAQAHGWLRTRLL
ncbi:MAG: insulinase family protein [Desulfovibrionaceae bacterium]|nr:insulinase family protein [Desulfovibrionaceae bacterium]